MLGMVAAFALATSSSLAGDKPVAGDGLRAPERAPPSSRVCSEVMAAEDKSEAGKRGEMRGGAALSAGNKPGSSEV